MIVDDILFDRQRHPEVARLSSGMALIHDPELRRRISRALPSIVELSLQDGRTLSRRVDFARGSHENPLTPDEVRAKYLRLTGPSCRARAAGPPWRRSTGSIARAISPR